MDTHHLLSIAWALAIFAGAVLTVAVALWLAEVVLSRWADYRLARWQRRNRIGLHQALRKGPR